eukprot:1159756-Pelagomonas_calceolata.AAC.17
MADNAFLQLPQAKNAQTPLSVHHSRSMLLPQLGIQITLPFRKGCNERACPSKAIGDFDLRWAEGDRFEASLLLQIAKDLASALGYLHSLHICHGTDQLAALCSEWLRGCSAPILAEEGRFSKLHQMTSAPGL